MTWRAGWNLDRAAGTYIVRCTGGVSAGGGFYFEAKIVATASASSPLVGVGNSTFQLHNPTSLDVSPPDPSTFAGAALLQFKNSGLAPVGRGYPSNINGAATTTFATGDTVGIAVHSTLNKLWWRNATTSPGTWWGNNLGGTQDPVAGTNGFDFTPSTGTTPISGNLFIVVGAGNEAVASTQDILLNFGATSFVATAPSGYAAWDSTGGTLINTQDADGHLTIAASALEITGASAIPGTNQPTAFARTNTSKART